MRVFDDQVFDLRSSTSRPGRNTHYIAQDNVVAALALLDRFDEIFELIAGQPGMGVLVSDISTTLHMFPVERYLVFYERVGSVRIYRVLHSAREWQKVLASSGLQ